LIIPKDHLNAALQCSQLVVILRPLLRVLQPPLLCPMPLALVGAHSSLLLCNCRLRLAQTPLNGANLVFELQETMSK
jgi:hypothetical protein